MERFVLHILKDFDYTKGTDKKYPVDVTGDEFVGVKTSKTNIHQVYDEMKNKLSKNNSLITDEFYEIKLGDTVTGEEIIFIVNFDGDVQIATENTEPVSSAFTVYMEENHPDVIKRINDSWIQKTKANEIRLKNERLEKARLQRIQEQRIKQQKRKSGIVDEDDRDTWPYWNVKYMGESGMIHNGKIRAINKSHAYDVAHDVFWDIADADDDKLTDIISITKA